MTLKIGNTAIYTGIDTDYHLNGEELICTGTNYDDDIQPSYLFKSSENGLMIELHEDEIEWIRAK